MTAGTTKARSTHCSLSIRSSQACQAMIATSTMFNELMVMDTPTPALRMHACTRIIEVKPNSPELTAQKSTGSLPITDHEALCPSGEPD